MDLYDKKLASPMLLTEKNKPFDSNDYLFEMKFDGIRAIIYASPNEITIKNKTIYVKQPIFFFLPFIFLIIFLIFFSSF